MVMFRNNGENEEPSSSYIRAVCGDAGAEMNHSRSEKGRNNLKKPISGCMGRMVNILDLNTGTVGRKMLTDRPNRDASPPICRNQPGFSRKIANPILSKIVDKPGTHELKMLSAKKANGVPMKMLIAHEMTKGTERKQKPPSVIAKLMGLDALPAQQPAPASITETNSCESYKHSGYGYGIYPSDSSTSSRHNYGEQEHEYLGKTAQDDMHVSQYHLQEEKEYKDIYEIWPQQTMSNRNYHHTLSKDYNEYTDGNRMALVRQKFMEAKQLAMDQRLLQTKEFQDALDVLNSNRDLFLKFLEEPSSLFSKRLQELRTDRTSPQTRHITILRPSSIGNYKNGPETRKRQVTDDYKICKKSLGQNPGFISPKANHLSQPTRIVVLRPNPRKIQGSLNSFLSSPKSSRGLLRGDCFEEPEMEEARGSRKLAKEATQKAQERLSGFQVDEPFFSPVLSHGYVGDGSSPTTRSEDDFVEFNEDGNFSDPEMTSPISRHSWDYVYRFGSPWSLSSSRTSYSPESSVIREAKKRLSERWAMVASNGSSQEKNIVQKSSSTLGEMLAFSELNKVEGKNILRSCSYGEEKDVRLSVAYSSSASKEDESCDSGTPRNLLRSKSVPVFSSAVYNDVEMNIKITDSEVNKSKGSSRSKNAKLSLKDKVSGLFSKKKRSNREKGASSSSVATPDRPESLSVDSINKGNVGSPPSTGNDAHAPSAKELACETSFLPPSSNDVAKEVTSSTKTASVSKNVNEHQDHPSPISVLEAQFEDDINSSSSRSSEGANLERSKLISRSPPIESVARTLTWDESGPGSSPSNISRILSGEDKREEQYSFVKSLLSSTGFDSDDFSSTLTRWHSLDSPLDPLLLAKLLEQKDEEAKCRERRSNRRLMFDCVNAALQDISRSSFWNIAQSLGGSRCSPLTGGDASLPEAVWGRISEWFPSLSQDGGYRAASASTGETISVAVDVVLRKEIADNGWAVKEPAEMEEIVKEIQGNMVEKMVEEAVSDMIPRWCLNR